MSGGIMEVSTIRGKSDDSCRGRNSPGDYESD